MNLWISLMQTVARSLQPGMPANPNVGLELKTGEVVYGSLLEMVDGETALLELKGQQVRAQTEADIPVGSRVPLLVVGPKPNGQLELKILPDASRSAERVVGSVSSTPQTQEPPTISPVVDKLITPVVDKLLENLGVTPSTLHKDIATRLLQAKITVQPSTLQAIVDLVQQETVEYQTISRQQNVPPDPVAAAKIVEQAIDTAISLLQKQIPLFPNTFQAMKTLRDGPPLHNLISQPEFPADLQAEVLTKFTLEMDQLEKLAPEQRGHLVQEAGKRLGLDHEARLVNALLTQNNLDAAELDTVKSLLLKEHLQNPAARPVEQALYHLTGQQLMHSARDEQSPFFYQFLALPMQSGGNPANADIHVLTRKKNGRLLDPDNCYLYFHLTMPQLGEMGIHVQVLERLVSLRLVTTDENGIDLPEADIAVLREGMQLAGYTLGAVRKETGTPDNKAPFSQLPILLSGAGVDFRI